MTGFWMLLKIHLMIILWLICFFGVLAVAAFITYLVLHYLHMGERMMFRFLPGMRKHS